MSVISKSQQSQLNENGNGNFKLSQPSPLIEFKAIANSLQPYATKNPKSLSYFIKSVGNNTQQLESYSMFTWIARDDYMGYSKKFECTTPNQIIKRYYEACVFIDMHSYQDYKYKKPVSDPTSYSLIPALVDYKSSIKELSSSIPDYFLGEFDHVIGNKRGCSSKLVDLDGKNQIHTTSAASINVSPANIDKSNTLLEINSTMIDLHLKSIDNADYSNYSDTATIYSDSDDDNDLLNSTAIVTKREVMDYLYPKYIYSYSDCIDDDVPIDYCKKPVMTDSNGSWHYGYPKLDPFQNQLVNEIREWDSFKEKRKNIMLKKSIAYRKSRLMLQNAAINNSLVNVSSNLMITDKMISDNSFKNVHGKRKRCLKTNELSLCNIKSDGRDSSGGYVLRKKNLVGISPLEVFDNKWAYEKILKDIKKQSKYDKVKVSEQVLDHNNHEKRTDISLNTDKCKSPKEADQPLSTRVRGRGKRGRIPKSDNCATLPSTATSVKLKTKFPIDYRKGLKPEPHADNNKIGSYSVSNNVNNIYIHDKDYISSNKVKSFGTRSPVIPSLSILGNVYEEFQPNLSTVSSISINNDHENNYFDDCNGNISDGDILNGNIIKTDGMLDRLFNRTHRSRKPPRFYDCYIPLDVNE